MAEPMALAKPQRQAMRSKRPIRYVSFESAISKRHITIRQTYVYSMIGRGDHEMCRRSLNGRARADYVSFVKLYIEAIYIYTTQQTSAQIPIARRPRAGILSGNSILERRRRPYGQALHSHRRHSLALGLCQQHTSGSYLAAPRTAKPAAEYSLPQAKRRYLWTACSSCA